MSIPCHIVAKKLIDFMFFSPLWQSDTMHTHFLFPVISYRLKLRSSRSSDQIFKNKDPGLLLDATTLLFGWKPCIILLMLYLKQFAHGLMLSRVGGARGDDITDGTGWYKAEMQIKLTKNPEAQRSRESKPLFSLDKPRRIENYFLSTLGQTQVAKVKPRVTSKQRNQPITTKTRVMYSSFNTHLKIKTRSKWKPHWLWGATSSN